MILLPLLLAGLFALAAVVPLLVRRLQRDAGYVIAAVFAGGTALLAARVGDVSGGRALRWSAEWVPALDLRLSLVLDGLALLFALVVLGIGAVVMAYSARYFKPEDQTGRIYSLLTAFAASMLGLVLAGDAMLLFVFWELTSILSFFLIGGRGAGAAPALRAFLVTGIGGLSLFGALVLMGVASGSFQISGMIEAGDSLRAHALASWMIVLLLGGAFTKSAQFPFQFWLPGAMVAPTPVSTYLHAATMVKAGIYLLARFTPVFGGGALWTYSIVIVGLVTAVVGALLALKQHDLKALLAYSTVSQLGWITALVGIGTFTAFVAAAVHIATHALYKATLFMITGIIDREAGSRDIRELSGLYRAMPVTATATGIAALSMAGFPPFLGFISKEESFAAFFDAPGAPWLGPFAAGLALVAAAMTFAYGARVFDEAFTGPLRQPLYEPRFSFLWPAGLTALLGLAFGLAHGFVDGLAVRAATEGTRSAGDHHISLWHGLTPALAFSGLTILGGTLLFVIRATVDRVLTRLPLRNAGAAAFDWIYERVVRVGKLLGAPFLAPSPGVHLAWILGAAGAAVGAVWIWSRAAPAGDPPAPAALDWPIVGLLALVCIGVASAQRRLAAVALLGLAGFLIALFYVALGAPDLALTQLLVETLTVVLVVLVFRRLPEKFHPVARARRVAAVVAALGTGLLAFAGAYALLGRRELSEVGAYYLQAGPEDAGGKNVVNTILVDFRALDTLGEITVLAVAVIGVYILARRRNEGTN